MQIDQLVVPASTPDGHLPTVNAGELVYAAPPAGGGGSGGPVLLAAATLAADAQGLTITGLSTAYRDLLVRCYLRNTATTTSRYSNFRLGSGGVIDASTNYDAQSLGITSSGGTSPFVDNNGQSIVLRGSIAASNAPGRAVAEFLVLNYADASEAIQVFTRSTLYAFNGSGQWKVPTGPVDSVQINCLFSGENLKAGSAMEVYGIT